MTTFLTEVFDHAEPGRNLSEGFRNVGGSAQRGRGRNQADLDAARRSGAESIDFLDIVFRLEREFGIKIPRGELFPEAIFQGDPEFVQNGKVTDKGLAELRPACRSPT